MNLEAFVFCFAGEYLSAKVRHWDKYIVHKYAEHYVIVFKSYKIHYSIERKHRRCCLRFPLVRIRV